MKLGGVFPCRDTYYTTVNKNISIKGCTGIVSLHERSYGATHLTTHSWKIDQVQLASPSIDPVATINNTVSDEKVAFQIPMLSGSYLWPNNDLQHSNLWPWLKNKKNKNASRQQQSVMQLTILLPATMISRTTLAEETGPHSTSPFTWILPLCCRRLHTHSVAIERSHRNREEKKKKRHLCLLPNVESSLCVCVRQGKEKGGHIWMFASVAKRQTNRAGE